MPGSGAPVVDRSTYASLHGGGAVSVQETVQSARKLRRGTSVATWSGYDKESTSADGQWNGNVEENIGDMVQFTSEMYFCTETIGYVEVDMMRIGACEGKCSVLVKTKDDSAKAGIKYKEHSELVTFEHDELFKTVRFEILQDDNFDTTLQFEANMTEPQGCQLAVIDTCRIQIQDDDKFPANEMFEEMEKPDPDKLSGMTVRLLIAYIRLTFTRVPQIWWKSLLTFCVDQLHNVFYLMKIYIQVYLVDVVLDVRHSDDTDEKLVFPGQRMQTAYFLGAMYIAPFFITFVTDKRKETSLEMTKSIRKHLQVNLFRKYLNFTEVSRRTVPVQELTFAMDGDIPMLVDDGYMFVFDLLKSMGKILATSYFMVEHDPRVFFFLVTFPPVIYFFLQTIKRRHVDLENDVIELKNESVGMVVHAVESFDLVRDYKQRDWITNKFSDTINKTFHAQTAFAVFNFYSEQFVPLISNILVGLYIAYGCQQAVSGSSVYTPGYVLAMIQIIQEIGGRFQDIFHDLERGITAGSPLVELCVMLNLETDVVERMNRNNMRRKFLMDLLVERKARKEQGLMGNISKFAVTKDMQARNDVLATRQFYDRAPVVLKGMSVNFIRAITVVNAEAHPGQLVFVTGSHGCGKSVLMRILADIEHPCAGKVLYPTHNRVLHVDCRKPLMLVDYTLWENIVFGAQHESVDRVRSIFMRLGLDRSPLLNQQFEADVRQHEDELAGHAQALSASPSQNDVRVVIPGSISPSPVPAKGQKSRAEKKEQRLEGEWHSKMSTSEAKRVHLARAFVVNPQVLVVHRPVDDIDSADVDMTLNTLREFVDRRGLEHPAHVEVQHWRPRMCFFSGGAHQTRTEKNRAISDVVWNLNRGDVMSVEQGGGGRRGGGPLGTWFGGLGGQQENGHVAKVDSSGNFINGGSSVDLLSAEANSSPHEDGRDRACWRRTCG